MADKLVSISDPKLLQSGIVKSLHPLAAPLWIDGQNVVFEDGAVRKSPGYVSICDTLGSFPITGMQDVLVGTVANLLFGDIEKLYRWDGSALTVDGAAYTGSLSREAFQADAFQETAFQESTSPEANIWDMTDWGEWCLATNNIDPIQINKLGGAGFVALAGTPPARAKIIIRYKVYVIAFNTDLGGAYAEWCDTDNVEDWVNGAAGNLFIRDLDSAIMAVVPLGEALAVYSKNIMSIFQYIGPDYYFGAKKALDGIGATGIHSVISRGAYNAGISQQGIWETDGATYNYISPPYLRKWIQDHVTWGQADKISGFLNEDRSLYEWGIPTDGASENNITLGHNYENRTWTFRSYGITCGLKKNAFPLPSFGMADGGVFFGEYGLNADVEPLEAWVQSKPLPGKDHLTWKDIEFLISYIKDFGEGGGSIYLGVQESLEDAIAWSAAIDMDEASDPKFLAARAAGRYISIKLYSNARDADWTLAGLDIWGVETGYNI